MTQWRASDFGTLTWIYALLGLLVLTSDGSNLSCLGGGSNRKQLLCPGVSALYEMIVGVELTVLNYWYRAQG